MITTCSCNCEQQINCATRGFDPGTVGTQGHRIASAATQGAAVSGAAVHCAAVLGVGVSDILFPCTAFLSAARCTRALCARVHPMG